MNCPVQKQQSSAHFQESLSLEIIGYYIVVLQKSNQIDSLKDAQDDPTNQQRSFDKLNTLPNYNNTYREAKMIKAARNLISCKGMAGYKFRGIRIHKVYFTELTVSTTKDSATRSFSSKLVILRTNLYFLFVVFVYVCKKLLMVIPK